jgi:hypothetical protein
MGEYLSTRLEAQVQTPVLPKKGRGTGKIQVSQFPAWSSVCLLIWNFQSF